MRAHTLMLIAAFLLTSNSMLAQQSRSDDSNPLDPGTLSEYFGLSIGLQWNRHIANFQRLPGLPNCCPIFTEGTGVGWYAELFYEHRLGEQWRASLRVGFSDYSGILKYDESTTVGVDGVATPGMFEHTIDASLGAVEVMPLLEYHPVGGLLLLGGGYGRLVVIKRFSQREMLVAPDIGRFENGRRTRNEFSGDIPDAQKFNAGLVGGIGYEFCVGSGWMLAPEVTFKYGLTSVADSLEWSINSLRAGIALKRSI